MEKMNFQECLNNYIIQIRCNGKELARNSKISETVISRYRKGERAPSADSEYLKKLSDGIIKTAAEKGIRDFKADKVLQTLRESLEDNRDEPAFNSQKLDILLRELDINISRIAAFLHYDPSYLSKIRTGKRNPAHQQQFIEKICEYVASNYKDEQDRKKVTYLIQCNEDEITDSSLYRKKLREWLSSSKPEDVDYVSGFLRKVDSFNLDDYIRVIHFDSFKVPKVPFQLPVSRHYYGLKEMREGELDFLKHTVLSKSMKPLYICSDMPVEDMAADKDFAKKYMFGLAMVLKKGLHIHIIHDVERPMKDMMLGLENWVPLYMTGQISPYYLKGVQNRVYSHLHYCSGQVAMTGDCISGHHDLAHYYLTSRKEEVSISQKNMEFLLKKAHPLMDIYREERKKELYAALIENAGKEGRRRRVLAVPDLGALPKKLLEEILERNHVSVDDKTTIIECYRRDRECLETVLKHSIVEDEVSEIREEEYGKYPPVLPIAECFLEKDIHLTYEEYLACIKAGRDYAKANENYQFNLTKIKGFHNIQITCFEGKWCMISKNRAPAIHFVIHHPKLRYALENMVLPIRDDEIE
ncbi:helix-turn-helix domain-containing protein [Blautia sp.]|uniref:helix-turn-helix domain-containing protein n=1 Tax=Blautia sp. TaxID=1955243 RepID=UPI003AF72786